MRKEDVPATTSISSISKARAFADAYNRISLETRVLDTIQKKIFEAFCGWAITKMGTKYRQYFFEAVRDFHVKCTLTVAETNRDIVEVAEESPFEFPLNLSKKRTSFAERILDLYLMAAEYEQVLLVVKSAKKNTITDAQFRLNLKKELGRFASEQNLEPLPEKDLEKILKRYNLRTSPFQIAQHYVGYKRCLSGTAVKKLLVRARDPKRMSASLRKYLKKKYLPKNFDSISRSFNSLSPD